MPNKADWFGGRWAGSAGPTSPCSARRNIATAIDRKQFDSLGRAADHGPRGLRRSTRRCAHPRGQAADVRRAARASTGRPPRRSRSAACSPKASACACRARTPAAAPSASATRSWVDQTRRREIHPAVPRRPRRPLRGARQPACPNSACSASNTAIRWPTRRRWCCGRRSSATSPTARRSSSTSSSPPARPSGCAPTASCMLLPHGYEGPGAGASARRGSSAILQLCAQGQHAGRATSPPRPIISTSCAGRCGASSASRWSS